MSLVEVESQPRNTEKQTQVCGHQTSPAMEWLPCEVVVSGMEAFP